MLRSIRIKEADVPIRGKDFLATRRHCARNSILKEPLALNPQIHLLSLGKNLRHMFVIGMPSTPPRNDPSAMQIARCLCATKLGHPRRGGGGTGEYGAAVRVWAEND